MNQMGCLYVPPGSPIRLFAGAVAWLWRLGPILDSPSADAIGMGGLEDAPHLRSLLDEGRLAGAVVFASRPGGDIGPVGGRARYQGVADFGGGDRVVGAFTCLTEGPPALRSSIGVHTTREDGWMVFGGDPYATWGALDGFWVLPALGEFLVDRLDRPLVMLPPVGWVRYDDVPGNAYQQLKGSTKPDREWKRRIERLIESFERAGAVLNVAVSARAKESGEEVGIEKVWPEAVELLAEGVRRGVIEPLCHGYLHLDEAALEEGRLEPREFGRMDAGEAGRKVDAAVEWMSGVIGTQPSSFIAPTWAYGEGLRSALAERRLTAWLPPEPGPLLADGNARETLISTLEGLHRLDYGPLARLAKAGLPPTLVIHGGLFDGRFVALDFPRDLSAYARLLLRRDLFRVPWVEGVRWIGATELLEHLARHAEIEVSGSEVSLPAGATAMIWDRAGVRELSA